MDDRQFFSLMLFLVICFGLTLRTVYGWAQLILKRIDDLHNELDDLHNEQTNGKENE